jgi:hypothetical protein
MYTTIYHMNIMLDYPKLATNLLKKGWTKTNLLRKGWTKNNLLRKGWTKNNLLRKGWTKNYNKVRLNLYNVRFVIFGTTFFQKVVWFWFNLFPKGCVVLVQPFSKRLFFPKGCNKI